MSRYILGRIIQGIVLLFLVSGVVFAVIHSAPGGPALLNQPDTDPAVAKEFAEQLRLNDPIPVQYVRWLGNLFRGSLGKSYQYNLPTAVLIVDRIPKTLLLSGTALLLAILLAVPLGIASAVYRYSAVDTVATVTAFIGVSIPIFWLGILLIIAFSVYLHWPAVLGHVHDRRRAVHCRPATAFDHAGGGVEHVSVGTTDTVRALEHGRDFAAFANTDVIACPTVAHVAPANNPHPGMLVRGRTRAVRRTGPFNLAGLPAISVPMGTAEDGLPVGLQIAGPWFQRRPSAAGL